MAGRIFCSVILLLSVGAWAGDQPPDAPGREAGEHARPAKSSVTARRRMLYHLAEGSEIFPLDWLLALKSVKTGKPFLEDPERFGLIPDPEMLEIPGHEGVKLPIGLTIGTPPDVLAVVAAIKRAPGPPDPLAMPYGRCQLRGLPCRPAPLPRQGPAAHRGRPQCFQH